MSETSSPTNSPSLPAAAKFTHPDITAKGETRARVGLTRLDTLWFNTGTLCNIECTNCYIESGPRNDRLSYMTAQEVSSFLDEIERARLGTREIGFTGGEPFMNPDILAMLEDALGRGFEILVLTNATKPLQRPRLMQGLQPLFERYRERLTFRVSLDHYSQELHERERGANSWQKALAGLDWLAANGVKLQIAGRTLWHEAEDQERAGYADLIASHDWPIDANDPGQLVLFPEMDETSDVPEITTACWGILGIRPDAMMCASSRMVVKRRGAPKPTVLPCTLIAYEPDFEMGTSLQKAAAADGGMFEQGAVKLCHPYCAKFCVLGGGSCSA